MNSKYQYLESLFEIVEILGQQNDFQEILRLLSSKSSTLFKAKNVTILMVNPQTHETIKTVIQEGGETASKNFHVLHTNVAGWIMKYKRLFLSPDIKSDNRFQKDLFKEYNIRSVMGAPLRIGNSVIGYLLIMNKPGDSAYSLNDLSLLEKLAGIVAPFLRNIQKIQEYFHIPLPDNALFNKYSQFGLLGRSSRFKELLKAIEAAARCDARVLLEGQSGTGKELIARAIHKLGSRRNEPFITIDCGAIPENLMESELFGYVKGAFTGATNDHTGLIQEAHGGTLFMDEIANLPLDMQAKLLRVLQEKEIRPVGSTQSRKVDVRIIAASSTRLSELVENKKFREDLFYRLHVYPIYVPTLNERQDDIPVLANHFLKKFAAQQQKPIESIEELLLSFMKQRRWAGNIRELENFIERLVILAPAETSELSHNILPPDIEKEFNKFLAAGNRTPIQKSLADSLREFEEKYIRRVLEENDWNQSKAARVLQVSEHTIRYKMGKLHIVKPQKKQ
ncbi:MAG: sigma-54-dependent Fis family transcriptional regulator [Calditrichaeota bacterium]|nr:sigma-54-dependent Fis family transcriptional regulator [Calditrichota bacterium]